MSENFYKTIGEIEPLLKKRTKISGEIEPLMKKKVKRSPAFLFREEHRNPDTSWEMLRYEWEQANGDVREMY